MISKQHPLYWRGNSASRGWAYEASTIPENHKHRFSNLNDPSWIIVQRRSSGRCLGTRAGYSRVYYEYWCESDNFYYLYTSHKKAVRSEQLYYTQPKSDKATCTCPDFKYRHGLRCKHIRYALEPDRWPRPPNQDAYTVCVC
jgi:hypothetical protein